MEVDELVQVLSPRHGSDDGFCTILVRQIVGLVPATCLKLFPTTSLHRLAIAVADSTPSTGLTYTMGELIEIVREPLIGNRVSE